MSPKADRNGEAVSSAQNAVEAIKMPKAPPAETLQSVWIRRLVLLSFWAVAVFFGLPVWWKTTTVYRAPLPLQQMLDWADGKVSKY
jgi:phosphatidylinositol glycan class S